MRADSRLLLIALFASVACKSEKPPPPSPVLSEVKVAGDPSSGLDEALARRLANERGRLKSTGGTDPYRVRVKIVRFSDGEPRSLDIEVTLEEQKLGGRKLVQAATAEAPRSSGTPAVLAERLYGDVIAEMGERLGFYYGPPSSVVLGLVSASKEVQLEATMACGERKLHECVDALIARLRNDDEGLRDAAVGALAAIGDVRAVRPLTEVARFSDLMELPKILEAVTMIGGKEARNYLEFVANGHDRAEVRALAKTELERIKN